GIILEGPEGYQAEYALRFQFKASNNMAEYEALVTGLRLAKEVGAQNLKVYSDSQLVVNQVTGNFETKNSTMKSYLKLVRHLVRDFPT
ncbi:ribonuclease HI family protein, partial [Staphylococcus aureus]|nr:ribonuclease HI family protein [Staphylococcus aureus]